MAAKAAFASRRPPCQSFLPPRCIRSPMILSDHACEPRFRVAHAKQVEADGEIVKSCGSATETA